VCAGHRQEARLPRCPLVTPLLPEHLVACSPKLIVLAPAMQMHRAALLTGRASATASGLLAVCSGARAVARSISGSL
jgi:hypothetical protein